MEPPGPSLPSGSDGEFGTDPDGPESLDGDPVLSVRPGARRTVLVVAAALAALLVGAVGVAEVVGRAAPAPSGVQSPDPTPTSTSSPIDWPTPRPATPTPARPSVFESGGFLDDLDVDVFVRSNRAVFRIDTRARRVTRTPIENLEYADRVSFLAVGDRVIVRPFDPGPGYAVLDDQPLRPLTGYLATDGEQLPGPSGKIWVIRREGVTSVARLTDTGGRRVYSTVRVPSEGQFTADGAGGLFVTDVGGVYAATNAGLRRVTAGSVVATGRDRFLTVECDEQFACSTYVIDRRSKDRTRVGAARMPQNDYGLLSPDGRYAATLDWRRSDGPHLGVMEVRTGRLLTEWQLGDSDGTVPAAWLPDGRLLGLASTRLFVYDPRTRSTIRPSVRLPPLRQLAVRLPAG